MSLSSYRPRNPGHDYYGFGTYLVTLVVSDRMQLLAHFESSTGSRHDGIVLTPPGEAIEQLWQ